MMNPDHHTGEYLSDLEFQSVLVCCLEKLERGESLDREQLLMWTIVWPSFVHRHRNVKP